MRLVGARIGGQLTMSGATLGGADPNGCALGAYRLTVNGDAFLNEGFATSSGAVRLLGAHIGGQLRMDTATLDGADHDGNALFADGLVVDQETFLDRGFTNSGAVHLVGARLRSLVVSSELQHLPPLGDVTGWRLDDVHGAIRNDRRAAAHWLGSQETAQPWLEMATVFERNGQSSDSRWMRYRAAVRSTRHATWPGKLARQAYRVTTGHGYYPLLAVPWLVTAFLAAWLVTSHAADSFTTPITTTIQRDLGTRAAAGESIPPRPFPRRVSQEWCRPNWDVPCLSPPLYAASVTVPAVVVTQPWTPPPGWWPAIALTGLRLASWLLVAVLLAGITGLLRQQT